MSREGSLERLVGQVLAARYRIGERLGAGAMGTVFRAEHVKIGRKLAVKVLHPQMLESPKFRRRFEREAELAGRMQHPNVIGVLDAGITPEGLSYLVMEYAEGRSLAEVIASGPLEGPRVLRLVRQLCDGLQHAHDRGLVHRDFKPDNVIVERDRHGGETPRILDFGVAIELADFTPGERVRLTTEGMVLGTPHYMAPEHAAGRPIDHRVDLFALGVMCFEMLTGVMPFRGTGVDIARAYLSRAIPPMQQRAPHVEVDPLLEAFTRALLAKSRDARPPSAKAACELIDLIERDRTAAAQQLDVPLEPRGTRPSPALPSPEPPPARAPSGASGARPPPANTGALPTESSMEPMTPTDPSAPPVWTDAPTEKMATDPGGPVIASAMVSAVSGAQAVTAGPSTLLGAPAVAAVSSTLPGAPAVTAVSSTLPGAPAMTVTARHQAPLVVTRPRAELAASLAMPKLERSATAPATPAPAVSDADAQVPALSPRTAPPARAYLAPQAGQPPPRKAPDHPAGRRRAAWMVAALAGVILCATSIVALRSRPRAAAPRAEMSPAVQAQAQAQAPALPAELAPAAAAPAPAPGNGPAAPPATATVARSPAPAIAPPAIAGGPAASRPTLPPIAAPRRHAAPARPAPAPAAAPPVDPPPAAVADLYGVIGRSLKRLDERRGQEATYDLWPRFRHIRIFEALRTRDGRVAALDVLRHLEREIDLRSN